MQLGLVRFQGDAIQAHHCTKHVSNLLHHALHGFLNFADKYLDNNSMFSKSVDEHLTHVRAVLQKLNDKQQQSVLNVSFWIYPHIF